MNQPYGMGNGDLHIVGVFIFFFLFWALRYHTIGWEREYFLLPMQGSGQGTEADSHEKMEYAPRGHPKIFFFFFHFFKNNSE